MAIETKEKHIRAVWGREGIWSTGIVVHGTSVSEPSQPVPNGYVDEYPHDDIGGPCTGPCCEPEAYGPNPWTCDKCGCQLSQPGVCIHCWEKMGLAE